MCFEIVLVCVQGSTTTCSGCHVAYPVGCHAQVCAGMCSRRGHVVRTCPRGLGHGTRRGTLGSSFRYSVVKNQLANPYRVCVGCVLGAGRLPAANPDAAARDGRRALHASWDASKNTRPHRRVIFHFFSRKFRIFPGRVFISPWLAATRFWEWGRK